MLNDITIMGRLTKPIEKKTTPSGVSVINNTVAVDRDRKNGDEKLTDFIDCVFWRFNADFLEKYADKGRMVVVHGRLESRKWQDKDGNNRISWEVQADNVYLADSKRDGSAQPAPSGSAPAETAPAETAAPAGDFPVIDGESDDLPF